MRTNSDCEHEENRLAWLLLGGFRRSEAAIVSAVTARHRWNLTLPQVLPSEPRAVDRVERAIAESRRILNLRDDWDGEGSPGYSKRTWLRVGTVLRGLSGEARRLPVPMISPAEAGSVDLYWGKPGHNLLLNVPADTDDPVAYYGISGQGRISGVLEEDISYLVAWILKLPT